MSRTWLFIRTTRVPIMRYEVHDVPGHYCQDGYRTTSTMISLSPEDRRAEDILTRSGVEFELVDLSAAKAGKKVAAWLRGVRRTPTLHIEGEGRKNHEGVAAISEYVNTLIHKQPNLA